MPGTSDNQSHPMNRYLLVLSSILVFASLPFHSSAQQASPLHFGDWMHATSQRLATTPAETWSEKRNYFWGSAGGTWELRNLTAVTRNTQNQVLTEVILTPGPSGLDSNVKYVYTYPIAGEPWTERLDQVWNGAGWDDNYRQLHAYDAQGNQVIDLELLWTGGAWDTVSGARLSYTYNGNNLLTEVINENWDAQNEVFEPISRQRLAYNSNNEPDTVWTDAYNLGSFVPASRLLDITWNDFNSGQPSGYYRQLFNAGFWANFDRYTWTYGPNGSYQQINLDWASSAWTIIGKQEVAYDAQERLTAFERFDFTNNAYVFTGGSRYQISDDADNQPTEIIRLVAGSDSIYNNIEKDEFTSIVSQTPAYQVYHDLSLFPNPFDKTLNLMLSGIAPEDLQFEVFDQLGRTVFVTQWRSRPGSITRTFELPDLKPGVYFYRLQGDNGMNSGTLLHQ